MTTKFFIGLMACLSLSTAWAQQYVVSTIAGGAPAPLAAAATSVALGQPGRVAIDPSGNVYFTALNSVYRLDSSGNVTRLAGSGLPGFSGDGGPAINAQLNAPQGLAVNSAGDVYIADTGNQRVRLVANGIIHTIAGNGTPGSSGDYGDPLQAQLHLPTAVAIDGQGNVYIADSANNVVREVSSGIITPFAGNYIGGFANDGNSANGAALNNPTDIVFDTMGNMFIADSGNGRIREVSGGVITSVVGAVSGSSTGFTEGGSATATILSNPHSVAVDSAGNLYIADSDVNRIRKVSKSIISTLVGAGNPGFGGDGSAANKAQINAPTSVAVDASGNLYFVDFANARIRKVSSGGTISTVAGVGTIHFSGDGGSAQNALMSEPSSVAVGPGGVLYVADTNNQRIRAIASNGIISTVAGNGTAGFGGDGAAATAAQIDYPSGLATDASGNLYFADTANQRVRKVSGGIISTVAGNGTGGYSGDGSAATGAMLNAPVAVAVDGSRNLYIADYNNHAVRKVTPAGLISTLAGNGSPGYSGDGGASVQAQLNGPAGLAVDDASGNVYVADSGNHVVREITRAGIITTLAGTGTLGDSGDGGAAVNAQLASPVAVAVDSTGNVYIVDQGAAKVRIVTTGGVIQTIAGSGAAGYGGDGGLATSARFNNLSGIAVDALGNIYLADRGNNAIRSLQLTTPAVVPAVRAVTNAASNLSGPISPGEVITIYGSGLGPENLATAQPNSSGVYPTQLAGTTVYVGGVPAPILSAWTNQTSVVVPYEAAPGSSSIIVSVGGLSSAQFPVQVAATAPGLFTVSQNGQGQAVAVNESGVINSTSTPAPANTLVIVYMTGGGLVTPSVPDGSTVFVQPLLPVTATLGGQPAMVQFTASTSTPGVFQVYVRIPPGVTGNAVPVVVRTGGVSSQTGVTVAVK